MAGLFHSFHQFAVSLGRAPQSSSNCHPEVEIHAKKLCFPCSIGYEHRLGSLMHLGVVFGTDVMCESGKILIFPKH